MSKIIKGFVVPDNPRTSGWSAVTYEREDADILASLARGEVVTFAATDGFAYVWQEEDRVIAQIHILGKPGPVYRGLPESVIESLYADFPDKGFASEVYPICWPSEPKTERVKGADGGKQDRQR